MHTLVAAVLASATTNASSCSQLSFFQSPLGVSCRCGCPMASQVLLGRFAWTLRHSAATGTPLILEKSCARLMTACSLLPTKSIFRRHISLSISSTEPTNSWLVIGRTLWLADGSVIGPIGKWPTGHKGKWQGRLSPPALFSARSDSEP